MGNIDMTGSPTNPARAYLSALMNIFWLRPETALWRALDCIALEDETFEGPILDLGCGNGLFSFVRAGGRLGPDFDAFSHVTDTSGFEDNQDIYNQHKAGIEKAVVTAPRYQIDVGLDQKDGLLAAASGLGLYGELVQGDANETLPFADGRFQTVFSNIVYWLDDQEKVLAEIARVLAPGGRAYLHLPSDTFRDFSFYQSLCVKTGDARWDWLRHLDRGRYDDYKLCRSLDEWSADFAAAGLQVNKAKRYLSKVTLGAWDIGLRPISPYLIEMANAVPAEMRQDIKRRWIEGMMPMLEPLCSLDGELSDAPPAGFFLFVLEKQA